MSDTNHDPPAPNRLPESLIEQLEPLGVPDLKDVLSYVEQRIESLHTPIEEEIRENAAGEIIEIKNYGAYAFVRKHPPEPSGSGIDTDLVSLYHVRRERQLDGDKSLHWTYLGDVKNLEQSRCKACGRTLDGDVTVCPHCGSDEIDRFETEG